MSSVIRESRERAGLTIYDLAARLGVTAGAVSQMERSEAAGTIKLATLERALNALGRSVQLRVVEPEQETVPFSRREERVAYELHRVIAKKLLEDPMPVLSVVDGNLAKMRKKVHGRLAEQWLDDWGKVTHCSVDDTVRLLLDTSEYAIEMRQNGPFAGVLNQEERLQAIERAAR